MINDLKIILARSPKSLAQDAAGITAIGVMMTFGLYMPSLF